MKSTVVACVLVCSGGGLPNEKTSKASRRSLRGNWISAFVGSVKGFEGKTPGPDLDVGFLSDNWIVVYGLIPLTAQRCDAFAARPKFRFAIWRLLPINSLAGK